MSKVEVNEIDKQSGSTLTIGGCGTTVQLGTGASQTGFGREGSVNWQTSSIKTSTFTAVSGEGYFCNTSGGAFTVNLPAGSAGAIVAFSDYGRTFASNNLTISPNGSENIGGSNGDVGLDISGQAATFVYVDGTKGWINVQNAEDTEQGATFITATGGSISTVCTNFKVHSFTAPGTFCVSAGSGPLAKVSYTIVGGGGGGGGDYGGGGGAGGFREARTPDCSYAVSPLAETCKTTLLSIGAYPVVVGGGGTATAPSPSPPQGGDGGVSTFNGISSAGGGGGGTEHPGVRGGRDGGSGGGASYQNPCGTTFGNGNTPPTNPPQGRNGGQGSPGPYLVGGGGGGATAVGTTPGSNTNAGPGGAGATNSITGSPVARAGGGGGAGGGSPFGQGYTPGTGGTGGGGAGAPDSNAAGTAGTPGTGGGGGGANNINYNSGGGGGGIVIIRYKFQ